MGVIEIERKFVVIVVALMAGFMLATPMVGLVHAGKEVFPYLYAQDRWILSPISTGNRYAKLFCLVLSFYLLANS